MIVRLLKSAQERNLRRIIRRPWPPVITAALLFMAALAAIPFLGRAFLPAFNEGTLTIEVLSKPGTAHPRCCRPAFRTDVAGAGV